MSKLIPVEFKNQRIVTTKVLASEFGIEDKIIQQNFKRNETRFTEGKHYYRLTGNELRKFKANLLNEGSLKFASELMLWTEKGAARHAKILDTDEAWDVYELLEETYFRAKEKQPQLETKKSNRETILEIIQSLSDDPFKNEAIIKLIGLVELPVSARNSTTHSTMSDNQFLSMLSDFIKKHGILKETRKGTALDKEKLYRYFHNYGLKKMEVLKTFEKLGLLPDRLDRTPVINYKGQIIRVVIINDLGRVV